MTTVNGIALKRTNIVNVNLKTYKNAYEIVIAKTGPQELHPGRQLRAVTDCKVNVLRGDGRVGRQEAARLSPSRKVVSDMADSIDPKVDEESTDPKKRFGTGRSFEEVLN